MSKAQIQKVKDDLELIRVSFHALLPLLPQFEIANESALPFGFKKHTRAVSWITEKVVSQNLAKSASDYGFQKVRFDMKDTDLHDCEVVQGRRTLFINLKTHQVEGSDDRNDIAAVKKLLSIYKKQPDFDLIYCCIGIRFAKRLVSFEPDYIKVFAAQFLPTGTYVNPANGKLQAKYSHASEFRGREEFISLLESWANKLSKSQK